MSLFCRLICGNSGSAAEPNIIGQSVTLDGQPYQVIGVTPESFHFPPQVRIWLPLTLDPVRERQGGMIQLVRVIARMNNGTSPDAVSAELATISRQTGRGMAAKPPGSEVRVLSLHESMVGRVRAGWLVLMGAVALILLMSCTNIAGVLLARAAIRRPEIAIRLALGANAGHLTRQLLVESLALTVTGASVGLGLAFCSLHIVRPFLSVELTAGREISLDGPVLLFTALVAALTGLAFGLLPVSECRRLNVHDVLKQGGRSSSDPASFSLRATFVMVQVALGLTLLVAAIGMIRTFAQLQRVDLGFDPERLLSFSVQLPSASYPRIERQAAFHRQVLERLRSLPGVEQVSLASAPPFAGTPPARALITVEGEGAWGPEQGERHRVEVNYADSSFWAALKIPFIEGRTFDVNEQATQVQAVVINASLRDRFFPGRSAVGKRLKLGFAEAPAPWLTVAGVVANSKQTALNEETGPMLFRPIGHANNMRLATYVMRSGGDPSLLIEPARRAIADVDRGIPLSNVKTMEQRLSEWIAPQRLRAVLLGSVAFLAMVMAATGLYGLLAYITTQRRGEIGVRMALGATSEDVLRLILWRSAIPVIAGLAIGWIASLVTSRFLSALLFGVSPLDPVTIAGASGLLFLVAICAAFVPAYRASKIDPVTCLRQE